jgi:hypothetical protein
VAEVARRRALLFRDGPDDDGHYLHEEPIEVGDIRATFTRSRWAWPTRARAER